MSEQQPLSINEIEALLHEALKFKDLEDAQNVARIQVRLVRGLKGIEVPYPIDGTVARKMADLEATFVNFIERRHGYVDVSDVAAELHAIMQS